jgi:lysophospholipase L1-like esterase
MKRQVTLIKSSIAFGLLLYSSAFAAEPAATSTSCAAALKQAMCHFLKIFEAGTATGAQDSISCVPTVMDRHVVGQGENGDWAFIGRYRNANAELIRAQIRPDVVFIGDSITDFWADQPGFARDSGRVGRGIDGQTSPQMLVRFGTDVINLKPRVVHIMAGTNDIAENTGRETDEEIEGYISSMVELAQLHGIRVVLASIPPAADFFWHKGLNPAPRIRALNKWLETYAMQQKLTYVDYWSVLSAPDGGMRRGLSDDGVHPNVNGYLAMEPFANAAITKALQ